MTRRILLACLLAAFMLAGRGAAQSVENRANDALRIYLARHGQTDWNLEGRTQGSTDIPLNATGRQQASRLKEYLKDIRIDAIYSSTLSRSVETADIVRGQVPWTKLEDLGERKFGKFEGRLANDPETAPELRRRRLDPNDTLDGGESSNQLAERVRRAIETIRKDHRTGTVLVVGHSALNQMFIGVLLNLDAQAMQKITQNNDEVYVLDLGADTAPRMVAKVRY
jgi:broad specificity phosphatase PhoE